MNLRIHIRFANLERNIFVSDMFAEMCEDPAYKQKRQHVRDLIAINNVISEASKNLSGTHKDIIKSLLRNGSHEYQYQNDFITDIADCCDKIIDFVVSRVEGTQINHSRYWVTYTPYVLTDAERMRQLIKQTYNIPCEITIEKR
jgi:hypothetical protein